MSEVTLEHIKNEHARFGALIEQYEKRAATTDYIIERAVIPLPVGALVAGPIFKDDGTLDYYLILHEGEGRGSHDDALTYAAGRGLKLPNRREGRLLQAAFPDLCAEGSLWLEEVYESNSEYAWYQSDRIGTQFCSRRSAARRAVAVSRFIPSVI